MKLDSKFYDENKNDPKTQTEDYLLFLLVLKMLVFIWDQENIYITYSDCQTSFAVSGEF